MSSTILTLNFEAEAKPLMPKTRPMVTRPRPNWGHNFGLEAVGLKAFNIIGLTNNNWKICNHQNSTKSTSPVLIMFFDITQWKSFTSIILLWLPFNHFAQLKGSPPAVVHNPTRFHESTRLLFMDKWTLLTPCIKNTKWLPVNH